MRNVSTFSLLLFAMLCDVAPCDALERARAEAVSRALTCDYVAGGKLCGVETFARNGANAMMFDAAGLLSFAPNNLLLFSNDFANAAWTRGAARPTPKAKADPHGGGEGWLLPASGRASYRQEVPVQAGLTYLFSLHLAPGTAKWATLDLGDAAQKPVRIDLAACAAGATSHDGAITLAVAGNGWCKVDLSVVASSGSLTPAIAAAGGDGRAARSGHIFAYGAQLALVTHQRTLADYHATQDAPFFGPRFGYARRGESWVPAGLLVEDSRVNFVRFSNDLTRPVWKAGATMKTARDQMGVDGVENGATRLIGGAVGATNTLCQALRVPFHDRIFSAFIKRLRGVGAVHMATDAKDETSNGATWRAIAATNEWTRVAFTQAGVANPITCFHIATPGDEIAVQYVQNENVPNESGALGASTPIATTTTPASRGVETLTSVDPRLLSATAFIVETSDHQPSTDIAMLGLANQRDELSIGLGETTEDTLYSTFPFPALTTANRANWTGVNRAGVAWTASPLWSAISLNGEPPASATGTVGALTQIVWGAEPGGGKSCNCFIRSWAAYPAMGAAELAARSKPGAAY